MKNLLPVSVPNRFIRVIRLDNWRDLLRHAARLSSKLFRQAQTWSNRDQWTKGRISLAFAVAGAFALVLAVLTGLPALGSAKADSLNVPVLSARRAPEVLAAAAADEQLRTLVEQLVPAAPNRCAVVYDGTRRVAAVNGDVSLIPASTAKILTASAALDVLGEATTFTTRVIGSTPSNKTINGDLTIVGGGDPLLLSVDAAEEAVRQGVKFTSLDSLAASVADLGVTRITGSIVGDGSLFDSERFVSTWDSSFKTSGAVGSIGGLTVDRALRHSGKDDVPAPDPSQHGADQFRKALQARGITVDGSARAGEASTDIGQELASIKSVPVADMVAAMLKWSDNTVAEVLLKDMAAKGQRPATRAAGVGVMTDSLRRRGVPMQGVTLVDGSGIDRSNKVTCNAIAWVLGHDGPGGKVVASLPRVAREGSVKGRMNGTAADGKVVAKTGTLSDVSGLAGVASPANPDAASSAVSPVGRAIAFTVLSNKVSTEQAVGVEDKLATALAGLPPPPSAIAYAPE